MGIRKCILSVLFLVLAFCGQAQVPTGVPQFFGGNFYQFRGYVQNDSGLLFAAKDTMPRLIRPGIVYRGQDSLFYYWNGRRYQRFGGTAEIDPTVSAWAKAPVKPTYTYAEISGTPTTWPWGSLTGIPSTFTPSPHNHVIADVTGLQAALDGKENSIAAGTTSQYWRGDKTWQTLNTTAVAEGTNLYYTDARARAAISLTTTGSSGAATYTGGVLNIPNYTAAGLGAVPTARTLTINGTALDLSANRSWTVGDVLTSGTYANPAWITSLAWSKITGAPAFITGNQTITLTGDVTGSGTTSIATSIATNSVSLADLAQVATGSFLGRVTAGTGNVETLTGTQATTLLDNFTASLKGVVPASGGGTVNFLRADGTWAPPPGGGGGINTLNTLTAGTQTFATGNTGTDFNISSATSTHTFNIPDASATARGVVTTGTQTIAGSKTFTSNLLVSPAGSTYGSPRLVGLGGFGVGEAVRLYIGDEANAIQNGEGSKFDMYSFWGIRLVGNRNTGTPLVIDGIRSSSDPSVDVIGTSGTNVVLRAKGGVGQTGNLQEWSNDANTVLASMSAAGVLTSAGTVNTGTQAIASTQSITSGTATTAANNVFRVEINPASVLATHTLTLPAAPVNGQIVQVHAGGTIAAGAAVVTAFTVSPNAGQTLYAAITPTQLLGGDIMEFTYYTSSTRWIRTK